jgi:hypothetical protein
MKKMRFAFIAVALMALLSAFATRHNTSVYKLHKTDAPEFTVNNVVYVEVIDATNLVLDDDYLCTPVTPVKECTFETTEQPDLRDSKVSITKTSWNSRSNIQNGLYQ